MDYDTLSSAFPVESKALLRSPIRAVRTRKGAVSLSLSHVRIPLGIGLRW